MVQRWFNPDEQLCDETGLPYAGGFLYFYVTGTSTPLAVYSNSGLSIARTNPVVLDSAGRAGDIFLQQAAYKVVLKDVNGVEIWTADPVWSSDYSTVAQFQVYAGNPNGNVAGTAGTQGGLPSSVIWDSTNEILYVCTTTGVAAAAVWTAVNGTAADTFTPPPQGYLTPTSGTPVITSDVTAGTAVYYTPYIGNTVPLYNGTTFTVTEFAELTLTLSASHAASTLYDVFAFDNSGTITLATGPAWTTSTAGAGARGTGASTTQIQRLNGIWVNSVQMTGRNGATTYTIAANFGTYLGTILIDATPGQITCTVTWGQSRVWGVWNAYNRQTLELQSGDATATWTYNNLTVRQSNGATGNKCTVLCGLAEEIIDAVFLQKVDVVGITTGSNGGMQVGIGLNSTTVMSGVPGEVLTGNAGATTNASATVVSRYKAVPFLGINVFNMLENSVVSTVGSRTWNGTSANMMMTTKWRG